jgi:CDP-2,3-bis-(O-geranylgeranyl)-sn-glycerol synthase
MLEEILKAIWFIIPAYIANAMPVIISRSKKLQKYNNSVDFGKKFGNKVILGKGKTWVGLLFGVLGGTFFGLAQSLVDTEILPISLPIMTISLAFMLSLGALVGDMIGSFIKRRLNFERGKSVFLLDQLDFIFGAFLFASFVIEINLTYLIILLIITPLIHMLTNRVGYKLGVKKEPW